MTDSPFDVRSFSNAFIEGKLSVSEVDELRRHVNNETWATLSARRRVRVISLKHQATLNDVCALLAMILEELQEHRLLK